MGFVVKRICIIFELEQKGEDLFLGCTLEEEQEGEEHKQQDSELSMQS